MFGPHRFIIVDHLTTLLSMTTHFQRTVSRSLSNLQSRTGYEEPESPVPSSQQHEAPSRPPLGFPISIEGPMVWSGRDAASFDSQILELSPADVVEVEQALQSFLGTPKAQHTFPIT